MGVLGGSTYLSLAGATGAIMALMGYLKGQHGGTGSWFSPLPAQVEFVGFPLQEVVYRLPASARAGEDLEFVKPDGSKVSLTVPGDSTGGDYINIDTSDKLIPKRLFVEVPAGAKPGMEFTSSMPDGKLAPFTVPDNAQAGDKVTVQVFTTRSENTTILKILPYAACMMAILLVWVLMWVVQDLVQQPKETPTGKGSSVAPKAQAKKPTTCEWMFGDVATGAVGIHAGAGYNPMRWSGSRTFVKCIEELKGEQKKEEAAGTKELRKVILKVPYNGTALAAQTIQEAIAHLEALQKAA